MADAAELIVRIRGDASDLEATISSVESELSKLEQTQSKNNNTSTKGLTAYKKQMQDAQTTLQTSRTALTNTKKAYEDNVKSVNKNVTALKAQKTELDKQISLRSNEKRLLTEANKSLDKNSVADVYKRQMCNHAKYITDMTQSYLVGNPVTYAVSDEYDIEAIKNEYLEQDMPSVDSEIVKNMSIYGKAYELIYADEKSKPRSVRLDPEHTFVCYSQSAFEKPLFAVYYYKKYDLDGYCTGSICRVYDESFIYTYTGLDSYTALSLQNVEPHYFFDVPIIEYRNNTEMQGDFEQLITQIDAYNVLMSDRINDKEQFVNSLLFLCNCDLDTEQAKKLLVERILMGDGDAKAEYLSKVLNEADTKVLRDDIKDDIHRLSHVPDLSDESFGNNLSGVAIKYKLLGFEQHVKNKERNFAKTLRKRLEIYNNFLVTLNAMKEVPSHRVDIGFTYNLPANELEIAQMINYLKRCV